MNFCATLEAMLGWYCGLTLHLCHHQEGGCCKSLLQRGRPFSLPTLSDYTPVIIDLLISVVYVLLLLVCAVIHSQSPGKES